MLRTQTCGDLRKSHLGEAVTLCGWVDKYRDHAGIVFIDLRDRYGKTQVKFDLAENSDIQKSARGLRHEDVIQVTGKVCARPDGQANPKLATGEIEVLVRDMVVLNKSATPPFEPDGQTLPNEELRLTHRYLDLRRPALQKHMLLRHQLAKAVRDYFDRLDFLEIETPMLGRSTPEGARDYLVPSRVHEGAFYALPQSPQLYKQILMVAGYDRYYQIARCFRDEDLRADRQPEFTQIDVEMAFVERDDIFRIIDGLVAEMVRTVRNEELPLPLPRYTYQEVMETYGTDKPDLRFGLPIVDVSEIVRDSGFGVFKQAVEQGGRVRGLCVKGAAEKFSRRILDNDLKNLVGEYGAKGLAYFKVAGGKLESSIAKFLNDEQQQAVIAKMQGEDGDLLLYVADAWKVSCAALAALRNRLGRELELYDPASINAAWVVDFPLLTWNPEENRWDAEHHPFCSIVDEDVQHLAGDPGKIRAQSYDLVCNGYEAASGSIRIHDSAIQQQIFDLLNISPETAQAKFGFLLDALKYGAPPHGGIALGFDRWVMLFAGCDNIRDVIAFPKTQRAGDLMTGAPSQVDSRQLRELHIKIDAAAAQPGKPESAETVKTPNG
ncbi:MAG: aspartate--tRNA ligase [Planctomyces sp.]|nr:aspartate--tRNA ligase [Planctomyces sp.]